MDEQETPLDERYNMDRIHQLKTWPEYWDAVFSGAKTFEARKDDRGFQVGDTLELVRWNPETKQEEAIQLPDGSGECAVMLFTISYILPSGGVSGLQEGNCILALSNKTTLRQ